jgi:hypothetical protein
MIQCPVIQVDVNNEWWGAKQTRGEISESRLAGAPTYFEYNDFTASQQGCISKGLEQFQRHSPKREM